MYAWGGMERGFGQMPFAYDTFVGGIASAPNAGFYGILNARASINYALDVALMLKDETD